jgi:hypothetical protein
MGESLVLTNVLVLSIFSSLFIVYWAIFCKELLCWMEVLAVATMVDIYSTSRLIYCVLAEKVGFK